MQELFGSEVTVTLSKAEYSPFLFLKNESGAGIHFPVVVA